MTWLQPAAKHQPSGAADERALDLEILGQRPSCPLMYSSHDELA